MGRRNLQFVWPKDGFKGKTGHRGFWGRLGNILTDRGPDVFLQTRGDNAAIKVDRWGNWDSYHFRQAHRNEVSPTSFCASRGTKRYDPQSRRYVDWSMLHDWSNSRVDHTRTAEYYPHFTEQEYGKMWHQLRRGRQVDPLLMGPDWHQYGPKRFHYEHDWFWKHAHRIGNNARSGISPYAKAGPYYSMMQQSVWDLDDWIRSE